MTPHLTPSTTRLTRIRTGRLPRSLLVVVVLAATLAAGAADATGAAPSAAQFCPSAQRLVRAYSARLGVPTPTVERSDDQSTYYLLSRSVIVLASKDCGKRSVVGHEYGHYVVDVASRYDYDAFVQLSAAFTTGQNWLRTSDDTLGFERAAHCIGYVLGGNGTYTRCPHRALRNEARNVIAAASTAARTN